MPFGLPERVRIIVRIGNRLNGFRWSLLRPDAVLKRLM
jgi:hypothetical protein